MFIKIKNNKIIETTDSLPYIVEDDISIYEVPYVHRETKIEETESEIDTDSVFSDEDMKRTEINIIEGDYIIPDLTKLKDLSINIRRQNEIDNLVVTLNNGMELDADEISQTRLSRALGVIGEGETNWVDTKGSLVLLNKELMTEAIIKAGEEQTSIWIKYNELKS